MALAMGASLCLLAPGVRSLNAAGPPQAPPAATALKVVELREPDGQILSYRHLAGSTDVLLRGTRLASDARVKMKIGSRPGFVELDINHGGITGLRPAWRLGKDYLTYVLWAVSVDGRASNLGEITFAGEEAVAVNLTTPYQTFWLMVTAEPNYAVVEPSSLVVLYSVDDQRATSGARAIPIKSDLFYFTRYATYLTSPGSAPNGVPNQLLQARKAIELAGRSAGLSPLHAGSGLKEEAYARDALVQARTFLIRAEEAYKENPLRQDVIQFARTAAQSAENARALGMGVVGGIMAHQLENELLTVRAELDRIKAEDPMAGEALAPTAGGDGHPPAQPAAAAGAASTNRHSITTVLKRPAMWFAASGWLVALLLLFRRRPA